MKNLLCTIILILLAATSHIVAAEDVGKTFKALQQKLSLARTQTDQAKALLELGKFYVLRPGEYSGDMSNARSYCLKAAAILKNLHAPKLSGDLLLVESLIEKESGNKGKGELRIKEALKVYHEAGLNISEGEALMELRFYFDLSQPELDQRVKIVEEALSKFKVAGDKLNQAHTYVELGDLYQLKLQETKAIGALEMALKLYEEKKYPNKHRIYNLLSGIYRVNDDLKNGLKYGLKAMSLGEQLHDSTTMMSSIYNHVGIVYGELSQFGTAIGYFRKALELSQKNNWDDGTSVITGNIIDLIYDVKEENSPDSKRGIQLLENLLIRQKNLSLCASTASYLFGFFIYKGDLIKAKKYLDITESCSEKNKSISLKDRIFYRFDGILYFIKTGNYAEAKNRLRDISFLEKDSTQRRNRESYYYYSYKVDSAQGNYRGALINLMGYKRVSDQIKAAVQEKQIQEMASKYESDKKDADLKTKIENIKVLKRDNDLQRQFRERAESMRNVTLLAIFCLVLLVLSLYIRWKENRKSNLKIADRNERLQQLVKEKEWLVREIHHRVKNNLQTIISLIDSQASYLENDAKDAVMNSHHRIQAMSLIHQRLYLADNTTSICMHEYIEDLVGYLEDIYETKTDCVFELNIENIDLDVSTAIPLGLILNEAITNAIKYAFVNKNDGRINIVLKRLDTFRIMLSVTDNGIGLPADFNWEENQSLGMSLMYGLATEVSGEMSIYSDSGTSVKLIFGVPEMLLENIHAKLAADSV